MAKMTVFVETGLSKSYTPFVIDQGENDFTGSFVTIRVPVPPGTTVYIDERYSPNAIGGSSQTYTITSDTDITLTLEGVISSDPSVNTVFSSAYLFVSLDGTDSTVYYSKGITRTYSDETIGEF